MVTLLSQKLKSLLVEEKAHRHESRVMESEMPPTRKTHWAVLVQTPYVAYTSLLWLLKANKQAADSCH